MFNCFDIPVSTPERIILGPTGGQCLAGVYSAYDERYPELLEPYVCYLGFS